MKQVHPSASVIVPEPLKLRDLWHGRSSLMNHVFIFILQEVDQRFEDITRLCCMIFKVRLQQAPVVYIADAT